MPAEAKPKPTRSAQGFTFNHAMIYTRKLAPSLHFYQDILGFRLIEQYGEGYARLAASEGSGTIALHLLGPGQDLAVGGIRLYFEVKDLDRFCQRLAKAGVTLSSGPKLMPWGWRHAYMDDPDGHEVSIYTAGVKRFRATVMKPPAPRQ